jgi:hypothetical protein
MPPADIAGDLTIVSHMQTLAPEFDKLMNHADSFDRLEQYQRVANASCAARQLLCPFTG